MNTASAAAKNVVEVPLSKTRLLALRLVEVLLANIEEDAIKVPFSVIVLRPER